MDPKRLARLAARVLGVGSAAYGAFLVVVVSALQAMDVGARVPSWMSTGLPLVAVAAALAAAVVVRAHALAAAGLLAAAAALLAWPLVALDTRPVALVVPALVLVAGALALVGGESGRRYSTAS